MKRPEPVLFLSDALGVYIPRNFATAWDTAAERAEYVANVSDEDWKILEAGPEGSDYWDAWQDVCDNAELTDDHGNKYHVYQDGDCWLIPIGMSWDDEADGWRWPLEENQE